MLLLALLVLLQSERGVSARCDFPRLDARRIDPDEFQREVVLRGAPVLLEHAAQGWPAMSEWRWERLRESLRGVRLRVGPGPYPSTEMSIDEYMDAADAARQLGREVPGVFQYGQVPTSWSLWAHKDQCVPHVSYMHPNSLPLHSNVSTTCELLRKVQVPRFIVGDAGTSAAPNMVSHSGFLIGVKDSGIDFHRHQAAINVIFSGSKEWYMKVPRSVVRALPEIPGAAWLGAGRLHCDVEPADAVCAAQRLQQMVVDRILAREPAADVEDLTHEDTGARRRHHLGAFGDRIRTLQHTEKLEPDSQVLYCLQEAGEVVFIPQETQHAVRNVADTVAMQMQWDTDFFGDEAYRDFLWAHLISDLDPSEPEPPHYSPGKALRTGAVGRRALPSRT